MRTQGGFTLLELLVAMFVAAIIFAMGYATINQAAKGRVELQEQQAKLLEMQTAMRVMEQDFVQLQPRPVRQPVGPGYQPALQSSLTTQPMVALTRGGWSNPTGLQRPALQRVAYFFDNGTLRREYWPVLDATQATTTIKRDLMTHLKSVSLRFMDVSRTWQTQWPAPTNTVGVNDPRSRPIAVEITLETEDWGKLVRIVEVAG
ncbi:MAG TPA: type II secretion system minor pseudopilin GspJ [Steroidobacteraceae bacterium]|nr:type II secretion system minor pseudopilin GspJ [Steroidobacteraceae bacterium]